MTSKCTRCGGDHAVSHCPWPSGDVKVAPMQNEYFAAKAIGAPKWAFAVCAVGWFALLWCLAR